MKTKSLCGRYAAVFEGHQYRSYAIDNETGVTYNDELIEKEDGFYAPEHAMTGYSAYASGMDNPNKYFTLYFADLNKGLKIEPYLGNTIIKKYKAIFKVPRKSSIKRKLKKEEIL